MRKTVRASAAALLVALLSTSASAQMFSYGGEQREATQSLSLTMQSIDFVYNGKGQPTHRLDWNGWAYGLAFDRPNFAASVVFGSTSAASAGVNDNLHIADASLSGWGEIVRGGGSWGRVGLPIVIHSDYRSVDGNFVNSVDEAFSYTVLGAGAGLMMELEPSHSVRIQAHAWPIIAMAFRSFEGFAGNSTMVDTDVQIHVMHVFGRYGLSAGYGFRWQQWNTNNTGLIQNESNDLFDYKSSQHMLRLGINW